MPASRPLCLDKVEQTACCPLQCTQASGIEVVRFEPALLFVIRVVTTAIIELQPYTRSAHPESHEFEQGWHWINGLHQSFVEPPTVSRKSPADLLFLLLRHRLKSCEATAFHGVEAQAVADKIKVLHYLVSAVDALGDDAGEDLPKKARAMEGEAESVEEYLHDRRNLERVVWGCENDSIRRHDLVDEHVPVVLQGAELLTLIEAQAATSTGPESMIAQGDDLVLDIAKRPQVVQELADGVICVLLAGTSHERGDSLHALISITLSERDQVLTNRLRCETRSIMIKTTDEKPAP